MGAAIIDGKALAAATKAEAAEKVRELKSRGINPCLAVILVGENPASQVYVRGKINDCAQCGIESRSINLPADTTQEALLAEVKKLAEDAAVHGEAHVLRKPALQKRARQRRLVGAGQALGQIERDAHFMGDAGLEGLRLVSLDAAVQFHDLPGIGLVLGLDLVVVGIGCKPLFNGCVKCFLRGNRFKCFCHRKTPFVLANKKQARVAC